MKAKTAKPMIQPPVGPIVRGQFTGSRKDISEVAQACAAYADKLRQNPELIKEMGWVEVR